MQRLGCRDWGAESSGMVPLQACKGGQRLAGARPNIRAPYTPTVPQGLLALFTLTQAVSQITPPAEQPAEIVAGVRERVMM